MAWASAEKRKGYMKRWREAHREERRLAHAAYNAEHRDELRAYAAAHRDERLAYKAAYYQSHREAILAKQKANRVVLRERRRASKAAYAARHSAEKRAYDTAYTRMHRAQRAMTSKAWSKAHPETGRARSQRYRARKAQAPTHDFTAAQWQAMQEHYGHCCVYCGRQMQRLEQDHIQPLSKGGAHTLVNIVPACRSCNARKSAGAPLVPAQPLLLTLPRRHHGAPPLVHESHCGGR